MTLSSQPFSSDAVILGARYLATYIAEHGPKQFAMIVDEGSVYVETMGRVFAQPAIAEKGKTHLLV